LKNTLLHPAAGTLLALLLSCSFSNGRAQAVKNPYPTMAPLDRYLIADEQEEVALARSAAPTSISDAAAVMVLRKDGFATVAKGTNGFVCIVERSWAKPTDDPEFWNPKMRAPTCFNPQAATSFLPIFLLKTKLVLAGVSPQKILAATTTALNSNQIPTLAPGAMCYMMSKQQYLSDDDMNWRPHLMFFVPGDSAASWGANLHGSPLYAGSDPEERVTVMMMVASKWSDGTPGASMQH
jgi:hypothetical protein